MLMRLTSYGVAAAVLLAASEAALAEERPDFWSVATSAASARYPGSGEPNNDDAHVAALMLAPAIASARQVAPDGVRAKFATLQLHTVYEVLGWDEQFAKEYGDYDKLSNELDNLKLPAELKAYAEAIERIAEGCYEMYHYKRGAVLDCAVDYAIIELNFQHSIAASNPLKHAKAHAIRAAVSAQLTRGAAKSDVELEKKWSDDYRKYLELMRAERHVNERLAKADQTSQQTVAGPDSDAPALTAIRAVNGLIDTADAAIAGNEHERASIMLALLESFTVEVEKFHHRIHGAWQCHPLAGGFHTLTARFRSVKAKYLKQFDDGKKDEITKNLKDAQDNFRNAIKINASSLGFDRKNTASAIEWYIDFLKETKLDAGEQDYFETMLANLQTPEKATAGLGALQNTVPDWLRGGRCSIAMSAPDKP